MKIIIIIFIFFFNWTIFAQQGWFQQTSGTGNDLYSVQFLNSYTGFAGGDGNFGGDFLKTTNSGNTWILNQTFLGRIIQIQFLNNDSGFILAGNSIWHTSNGGVSWEGVNSPGAVNCFQFIDMNTGYGISDNDKFIKTTDRGNNWINPGRVITAWTNSFINNIRYFNDNFIIASGLIYDPQQGHGPGICRSTNGGNNWQLAFNPPYGNNANMNDISFPNANYGFGVGYADNAYYFFFSTNSGVNWDRSNFSNQVNSIYFTDNNKGWLVGSNGGIYFTTNSGTNFLTQSSPVSINLKKIFMVNNLTGWIVGSGGTILSTTNGGITSFETVNSGVPKSFSLSQNFPNPFNPATSIKFSVPQKAFVTITIYNVLGEEITKLVNEEFSPGTYETTWDASNFPSGVYYYQLSAKPSDRLERSDGYTETKKMVLIK